MGLVNPWVILAAVVIYLASIGGAFYKGIQYQEAAQVESQRDALISYANRVKEVLANDDKNTVTINTLTAKLARMRVHIPTSSCTASTDTDEASRLLSIRVDESFGTLQLRAGELFLEADELNKSAIRSNGIK